MAVIQQLSSRDLREKLDRQGFIDQPSLKKNLIYFQQTHLGPSGKPLEVTGKQDEATLWAVKHPSGKAQRSGLKPKIPKGIGDERKRVLEIALKEHAKDVKERPNGSNRSKEIDKYFPGWLRKKLKSKQKGPAWCAYFVNWVFEQVCGRPWGGYIGSCKRLVEAAKKSDGCEVIHSPKDAAPGDIFVILHGATGHVGLVLRKDKHSAAINTVEGNCGNRVKVGKRQTKDITCYIRVFPTPESTTSPLLAMADVGKAGTR